MDAKGGCNQPRWEHRHFSMIYAKGFFIFPFLPSFIPGNGAANGAPTRKRAVPLRCTSPNGKEGSGIPPWRHRSVVHSWDGVCCIFWPFFVHLTDKCCPLFTSWYTMSEHSFYQPKKCSTVKYFITLQEILLHLPFTKNILYLIWQMELAAEHCHVPSSPERRYNLG